MPFDESREMDGHDFTFIAIGIFICIMALGTISESLGLTNFLNRTNSQNRELSFKESLLESDLDLGDNTINIEAVVVRQTPAGSSIGSQKKGEKGRTVEGPVFTQEEEWWRVNYPEAPSGWVNSNNLTNRSVMYVALNIVPITLGFLKPIIIIFSVIIVILILIVSLKFKELNKINKKKANLEKEQEIIRKGHDRNLVPVPQSKIENEVVGEYETEDFRNSEFEEDDEELRLPVDNLPIGEKPKTENLSNKRWANIQSLVNSYNMNDWKQAIIEADTILDEMLDKMGYKGSSIGEKLKQAEPGDFLTINHAWEAHKIRNRIAHSGTNFTLSKNEAERVMKLYEDVFKEFFYI